ncbi:hypothetical protein [Actinokineospora sp. NBRC 105648]|uniref:hypothetical protein n=1 Tax=Actinokineospora sp. NBRC 105648 TaxID=3032206 RepID=UPI0024A16C99|nr:hypothetical protein [Actinokineospora sp. NBRC 105648]GLZ39498.1 hypothetical protein Acsp05_31220 [Actinokineospora sp. NBRC 105648]
MPYAVWLHLDAPEPIPEEFAGPRLPRLIVEVIEAGWPGDGTDLLDVRVLAHPEGAIIGLALDTEDIEVCLAVATSLTRHLAATAPFLGWSAEELQANRLPEAAESGDWLAPIDHGDDNRFPVAEHLSGALRELSAQFLLAGAVRDLCDPAGKSRYTADAVDAFDLVEGAVEEQPWDADLVGELGTLVVAAARAEATTGVRRPLTGYGAGDADIARGLLEHARADADLPVDADEGDRLRGHALLERFMAHHGLRWHDETDGDGTRAGDGEGGDGDEDEEHDQEMLRALLWAGLRTLATLTQDRTAEVRTPWQWLAGLDSTDIDPVVEVFAARDEHRIENSDETDEGQLVDAAQAHIVIRVALRHPRVLAGSEIDFMLSDPAVAGCLVPLTAHVLLSFSAESVEDAAEQAETAERGVIVAALRALEVEDEDATDPLNDLYTVLERVIPARVGDAESRRQSIREFLALFALLPEDDVPTVSRALFTNPAHVACVVLSGFDSDEEVERKQRGFILAEAAAIDPALAADFAADTPALRGADPRDEPALRNEIGTWWRSVSEVLRDGDLTLDQLPCPEPGAALLCGLLATDEPVNLDDLPLATAMTGVVQVVSAVTIAMDEPEVAAQILL